MILKLRCIPKIKNNDKITLTFEYRYTFKINKIDKNTLDVSSNPDAHLKYTRMIKMHCKICNTVT